MSLKTCTLIKKIPLTNDVWELHYDLSLFTEMKSWQFITFIMKWIGGRSYSILEILNWKIAILVIKRWGIEDGGRGWSLYLCDAQIGEEFQYVWPAGHFNLSEGIKNRLFLGTGTWLVPLYNQILFWLARQKTEKYQLVFGVRYKKDLYYLDKFEELKKNYPNTFYYHLIVSRDTNEWIIHNWYVTDFISSNSVKDFEEYYICWVPSMIESCEEQLFSLWIKKEQIFFEKYA